MNTHKVQEIFVGGGGALGSNLTTLNSNQIGIFGNNNTATSAGNTFNTAGQDSLTVYTSLSDGSIKKSFEIKGDEVINYQAESYQPAKRQVVTIGAKRNIASSGAIIVNNNTFYMGTIVFKNDKFMYSERPEKFRFSFTSSTTATQSNIADQIVAAINNSTYGTGALKQIKAMKVGDGTGPDGTAGATNFGVEIWSLDVNQYPASSYVDNQVYFSVHVDSSFGFGLTPVTVIQNFDPGIGTYRQVYTKELFCAGYEGIVNRTKWPIPTIALGANSSGVTSGNIGTLTVSGLTGTDSITATASNFSTAGLEAGSKIIINTVTYEIKYLQSNTVAILTSNLASTATNATVKSIVFYDVINLTVRTSVVHDGPGVVASCDKMVTFATPAIDSNATSLTANSTEGNALIAILNPWVLSTPAKLSNVAI